MVGPGLFFAGQDAQGEGPADQGAALFGQHCALCHGEALEARTGMIDLRQFQGDEETFRETVSNGRGLMPSFDGVFTPDELTALYAYIQHLEKENGTQR